MGLAVYLHDIDRYAIRLTDSFGIPWYGLSYLAGFAVAWWIFRALTLRGKTQLKDGEQVGDFLFYCVLGTILGGRIGYGLFYNPGLFAFSDTFPYWNFLAIHTGGMASHGGMIGLILACVFFARKRKISALHLCDLIALAGTVGVFFGRIANFVNGELYGRAAPEGLAWAVKFPQEMADWGAEKQWQLRQVLAEIGMHKAHYLELVESAMAAIQKGDERVIRVVEPLLVARHPSQLYAALLEGLLLFVLLWVIWRKPRKPGVIGGWFLVLYAAVRIFDEMFRTPDAHIGFQWLGLTRGQWLSAGMLVIGVGCLIHWSRRKVDRIGGWALSSTP